MKMRNVAIIVAGALVLLVTGGTIYFEATGVHLLALITARQMPALPSGPADETSPDVRPPTWAQAMQRPGLPNLFKVTDDLYRGAQPTAEGFEELKAMGIKTVVNLRGRGDNDPVADTPGLDYEHIAVEPFSSLDADEVARFLRIVRDKARTPVFVHCHYGADRTGALVAAYRIAVQDWTKDEALREMTRGGFGYHEAWKNLLIFIRRMDVEALRQKAGLPAPDAAPAITGS